MYTSWSTGYSVKPWMSISNEFMCIHWAYIYRVLDRVYLSIHIVSRNSTKCMSWITVWYVIKQIKYFYNSTSCGSWLLFLENIRFPGLNIVHTMYMYKNRHYTHHVRLDILSCLWSLECQCLMNACVFSQHIYNTYIYRKFITWHGFWQIMYILDPSVICDKTDLQQLFMWQWIIISRKYCVSWLKYIYMCLWWMERNSSSYNKELIILKGIYRQWKELYNNVQNKCIFRKKKKVMKIVNPYHACI